MGIFEIETLRADVMAPAMRPIRVLLVSPSQGSYGGIEAFLLELASYLQQRDDISVRVCLKMVKGCTCDGALRRRFEESSAKISVVQRGSLDLAREIAWADVVHGQNASPDICILARLCGKPLFLTIHNRLDRGNFAKSLIWRSASRLARARWYNSQFVWDTWEKRRKRGSACIPTVCGLSVGFAPFETRKGFVFVGRWIANKGINTLVEAYEKVALDPARWPLTMMGDGPLRQEIEERVSARKLPGVRIPGFVDESAKRAAIMRAKWMVVPPNTREDMGLTPLEARACGVPCIITRDGGLPESGGPEAIVCEPGDATALASALKCAVDMDEPEYERRSIETLASLKRSLVPLSFYVERYREAVA